MVTAAFRAWWQRAVCCCCCARRRNGRAAGVIRETVGVVRYYLRLRTFRFHVLVACAKGAFHGVPCTVIAAAFNGHTGSGCQCTVVRSRCVIAINGIDTDSIARKIIT